MQLTGFAFHPSCCCQVFALQRQLSDANASSAEIGASSAALMDLVGEGPALQAMLNCYSHKIRLDQSLLLKQHTAGATGVRHMVACRNGAHLSGMRPLQAFRSAQMPLVRCSY
jgi:hypothetical protein